MKKGKGLGIKKKRAGFISLSLAALLALNSPIISLASTSQRDVEISSDGEATMTGTGDAYLNSGDESDSIGDTGNVGTANNTESNVDSDTNQNTNESPENETGDISLDITGGEEENVVSGTSDVPEEGGELLLNGTRDASEQNAPLAGKADKAQIVDALNRVESYLQTNITDPAVDSVGGEWSVMAMARYGMLSESARSNYLANLYMKLNATDGVLSTNKYTEYSRVTMALSAIGVNPENVGGYNLLVPLADYKKVISQGINGPIFALIAFDTKNYDIPALSQEELAAGRVQTTRDNLIAFILSKEIAGGGWTLSGRTPDPDMTGMAIQALAAYTDRADVKAAVDRGVEKLGMLQAEDGGFSSGGDKNLESAAQVAIALSTLDVALIESDAFIKEGASIFDYILSYQLNDGSFSHIYEDGGSGMATEQGALSLLAWTRAINGQKSLYDMTDVESETGGEQESQENIESFRKKLDALPEVLTIPDKNQIYTLIAELDQMKDFPEKNQFYEILKAKKDEIATQEKAAADLDDDIWNTIKPLNITLQDKENIEALLARYNLLPEANRGYVKNAEDLLRAGTIINKLVKGVIAKEIFENVKNSKQDYTYQGKGYQITLKGKNVYDPKDMKAEITIVQKKDSLNFTLAHVGSLPGEVEISVDCTLEKGMYILYQDNDGNQKKIQKVSLENSRFTCKISEGGGYVLKKEENAISQEPVDVDNLLVKGTKLKSVGSNGNNNKNTKTAGNSSSGSTKTTSNTVKADVKDGVVAEKAFEDIKGKDKNLKISGEINKDKPYTLTIYGKDIKKAMDMKVGIKENSRFEKEIKKLSENPYIFRFEQTGDFPGEMLVEMTVDLSNGEYLLMRYNEKDKKAEYIQKIEVKDKKTKFILSKGGDYFISKRAKSQSIDELEAEENADKKENSYDKTADSDAGEEEAIVTGTKEVQKNYMPAVIAAVFIVIVAGGGIFLYYRKKRL